MNFYFEYAYDASRWAKEGLHEYLVLWATREWGAEQAEKTAEVFERYMHVSRSLLLLFCLSRLPLTSLSLLIIQYVSRQKPELTMPTTYSLTSFNEADRVVKEWDALASDAWCVYNALEDAAKDSFFEMILHPIRAVGTVTKLYINVGRNNMHAVQARQSTNTLAQNAIDLFNEDAAITREYHQISEFVFHSLTFRSLSHRD